MGKGDTKTRKGKIFKGSFGIKRPRKKKIVYEQTEKKRVYCEPDSLEIKGKITGIKYKVFLAEDLNDINIDKFDINDANSSCRLNDGKHSFAVAKWVSPKRTRSYPYERVYNTLNVSKKITVIPIIKDEGIDGDRDFLQWDTVSLMSLLDVFVIFAYYNKAVKNENYENKITNFQFDNKDVISKIKEIEQYHSSASHWNLNELKNNLHSIIDKAKKSYIEIGKTTGAKLHDFNGIDNFKEKIGKDVEQFMQFSREKAKEAQSREIITTQPKEALSTLTKAKIIITNYLGGQYFFTVDEIETDNDTVSLIESKHSKNAILPSIGDIKDGLLKMILYSNLCHVSVDEVEMKCKAVLNLTSTKLKGELTSEVPVRDKTDFLSNNNFSQKQIKFIDALFDEAKENGFIIKIGFAK
ncbi:MAG: 30S ribosomal protein THX [Dysgonamonadaceae bacterium]|jgi:ribosomal small subunit protein bTHX|nr:30S ribosomal protein THX [Dysgonamonadaceae bacterium]